MRPGERDLQWQGRGAARTAALTILSIALGCCAAISGHAALRVLSLPRAATVPGLRQAAAVATDQGAALPGLPPPAGPVPASPADVANGGAPGRGTTGTITLPATPAAPADGLVPAGVDATIHPARAFSLGRATAVDRGRALECLTDAIYYEAATEPDAGQQAVAQVILNRVRHPAFPASVCGVVYQGSDRLSGCQFSFACDGSMARARSRSWYARAARVAAIALAGRVYAPVGLATHYHSYAVTPAWNRGLVMTAAIGAHFFHRWPGYWGTPAAFHQVYAGREPVPGPLPRPILVDAALTGPAAVGAVAGAPMLVQPTPRERIDDAQVRPAYAASGVQAAGLSGDGQILDRWKDAGKPLR